ncbi:MAG: S-layer homology domain-containing protein, partial [Oscillospiraceae bacterium]
MHKKFISILLSIILMMTTLTAVAKDSVEMKNSETDIEINLIKSLGIIEAYENGDFGENDAMTRGELAIAIMKFLKIDESKEEYKDSYYEDVKSDMDCFNAVKILTDLEIFNKGGMFRPSDRATMDETIKIVVTALGYDIVAGDNGGYPNGYMKVARNIALTDGVNDLNTADYVTRGTVARLCFNGFDIKPLYGYKSGEKVIITESNLTFGEEYYHLKSINGIVEKTEITGLFDTDKLSSNKILVADTMFNIGDDTDITSLLGQYVTAYYTDINNTYTLICMDESRNKKLTLTDENEPSLNGKRLEYYQDGRQKYVNLGKGAIPIYNNTVKIDGEIIIPK